MSRVGFVLVGLIFIVLLVEESLSASYYIRNQRYGSGNGTNWNNAFTFSGLGTYLPTANPGDVFYIRADEGAYVITTGPYQLKGGGVVGNRVRITGVDVNLRPAYATFVGNRQNWTLPVNPEQITNVSGFGGSSLFNDIQTSSIEISFMNFVNYGYVLTFGANVTDVLLQDVTSYNVVALMNQDEPSLTVTNITVNRATGTGYAKQYIRFRGNSNNITVSNVIANSGRQAYSNWASGFVLDDTAHDVTVVNCYFYNGFDNQDNNPSAYWNGDGYSTERGNYNINFVNCSASGWTDGGWDCKSNNLTLTDCSGWDNKRNFRLWGYTNVVINNINSTEPHVRGGIGGQSHIFLADNSTVRVNGGVFNSVSNATIALYVESYATLTLANVVTNYNGRNYIATGGRVLIDNSTTVASPSPNNNNNNNSPAASQNVQPSSVVTSGAPPSGTGSSATLQPFWLSMFLY